MTSRHTEGCWKIDHYNYIFKDPRIEDVNQTNVTLYNNKDNNKKIKPISNHNILEFEKIKAEIRNTKNLEKI